MNKFTYYVEFDKVLLLDKIYFNFIINDQNFMFLSKKTPETEEVAKSIEEVFKHVRS